MTDIAAANIQRLVDRERRERKAPKIRQSGRGKSLKYDIDPVDAVRLISAFGTDEPAFANLMLSAIINAAADGSPSRPAGIEGINRALAAVTGIGAQDEIEGMLATQMVATHIAATTALRRLKGSETVLQQDSNGNLAVKLLRTFTMQVEALQRYRSKGQQKIVVEHVNVHGGGQAIVGNTPRRPTLICAYALSWATSFGRICFRDLVSPDRDGKIIGIQPKRRYGCRIELPRRL